MRWCTRRWRRRHHHCRHRKRGVGHHRHQGISRRRGGIPAARRLTALGAPCLLLTGSLADKLEPFLSEETRNSLVLAKGDALSGALYLARAEAHRLQRATAAANG